jgi:hypothetical protein
VKNIQTAMVQFNMEIEKQEMMSEQISDIMSGDEDEVTDADADKLIQAIEDQSGGGGKVNSPKRRVNLTHNRKSQRRKRKLELWRTS